VTTVDVGMPVDRRKAFSASNAARFAACPASADLAGAIPGWVPPVVDPMAGQKGRGTNMHALLEQAAQLPVSDLRNYIRALDYYHAIRSTRRFNVLTEESVTADWLQSKPRTTVDVVLHLADELHVMDWKWGKIPVEVIDNEQLLYYAACFAHLAPKAKGVWLHIIQPTADNMEAWYVSATDLQAFVVRMQQAEAKVLAGDHTFGPSDHCKFCPANPHSRGDKGRPLCPAMMQLLYPPVVDEQAILDL